MKMKHLVSSAVMEWFFPKMAELSERKAKVTSIKIEPDGYVVKYDVPEDESLVMVAQIRRKHASKNHFPKPKYSTCG